MRFYNTFHSPSKSQNSRVIQSLFIVPKILNFSNKLAFFQTAVSNVVFFVQKNISQVLKPVWKQACQHQQKNSSFLWHNHEWGRCCCWCCCCCCWQMRFYPSLLWKWMKFDLFDNQNKYQEGWIFWSILALNFDMSSFQR